MTGGVRDTLAPFISADCGLTAVHRRHPSKFIKGRRVPGFTECVNSGCGAGWDFDNEETPMDLTARIDRILFDHARDDINPARGEYGCDCADKPGEPTMTAAQHRRHVAEQIAVACDG